MTSPSILLAGHHFRRSERLRDCPLHLQKTTFSQLISCLRLDPFHRRTGIRPPLDASSTFQVANLLKEGVLGESKSKL